jgi:uncharacterized protein
VASGGVAISTVPSPGQVPAPAPSSVDSVTRARSTADTTFAVPTALGFVNDFAELLSEENEADLEDLVLEVRDKSGGEIAVVTLPSLGGRTPQAVAMAIGRTWGVGFRGDPEDPRTHTGVIVLVAPTERHVRIELGTGANAFISDAEATAIAEAMSPCFAKGKFADGLRVGVVALALRFAQRFAFTLTAPTHLDPC